MKNEIRLLRFIEKAVSISSLQILDFVFDQLDVGFHSTILAHVLGLNQRICLKSIDQGGITAGIAIIFIGYFVVGV